MKSQLVIEKTEDSPRVVLDADNHVLLFEGESRPAHAYNFYKPIITWLEEYRKILEWEKQNFDKRKTTTVRFKLTYFNSTSAKFIGDILTIFESLCKDGYDVNVKWFYQTEDTDMKESGEEYMKMVKNLPVKLVLNGTEE